MQVREFEMGVGVDEAGKDGDVAEIADVAGVVHAGPEGPAYSDC